MISESCWIPSFSLQLSHATQLTAFSNKSLNSVIQLKLRSELNIIASKIPAVEIKTIILCFKTRQVKNNKSDVGVGLMKCYDTHSERLFQYKLQLLALFLSACRQFCKYFSLLTRGWIKTPLKYLCTKSDSSPHRLRARIR